MAEVVARIDVDADPDTAYALWTNFEDLPRFMRNVEQVILTEDEGLLWVINFDGRKDVFYADVVRDPCRRVAWRSVTEEVTGGGEVTFEQPAPGAPTTIAFRLVMDPRGIFNDFNDKMSVLRSHALADLVRFKHLIETAA